MPTPQWPFIGSEALANGQLKKHQLRAAYRIVFPDVYVPAGVHVGLEQRARAAWLWSHREGVIAGLTASALHGARWVDDECPIELIWGNARPPRGVLTSAARLQPEEITNVGDLRVTTVARTAFDIARRPRLGDAVARLDALGNARAFDPVDVLAVAGHHRGARGIRRLAQVLDLYDPGAASPKETWLRLLLLRAGYPRPQTQISVRSADRSRRYYLDLGWPELMVAVEYDGQQHRVDHGQYAHDIRRSEHLHELGWTVVRVINRDGSADILARVARAWTSRLRADPDSA